MTTMDDNFRGQILIDTQKMDAPDGAGHMASGAQNDAARPKKQNRRKGHCKGDTPLEGARPANGGGGHPRANSVQNAIAAAPTESELAGHLSADTQRGCASKSEGRGHIPRDTHPDSAPSLDPTERRGHPRRDTQDGFAAACDEGGQRRDDTPRGTAPLDTKQNNPGHVLGDTHKNTAGAGEEGGQRRYGTLRNSAPLDTKQNSVGHPPTDAQKMAADAGDDGPGPVDTQMDAAVIAEITALSRHRRAHQRADQRLVLQIKAMYRSLCDGSIVEADKLFAAVNSGKKDHPQKLAAAALAAAFFQAREPLLATIAQVEKRMTKLAKELPVYDWWTSHKGLNALGLATIIGETGDLSNYPNPGKLWARLGLSVDEQGRAIKARKGVDNGYCPQRRSMSWRIVDSFFKHQGGSIDKETGEYKVPPSEYRQLYDDRKAYELERKPDMTPMHAHRRAARYMEKRLLRNLWRAWRQTANEAVTPIAYLPDAANGAGHERSDTQSKYARPTNSEPAGHGSDDTHDKLASGEDGAGHRPTDTQGKSARPTNSEPAGHWENEHP